MSLNPIVPNHSQLSHIGERSSGQGLNDREKSGENYRDAERSMDTAVGNRNQLTRTGKASLAQLSKNNPLHRIGRDDSESDTNPTFVTLMVDGSPWTLRHVAYA